MPNSVLTFLSAAVLALAPLPAAASTLVPVSREDPSSQTPPLGVGHQDDGFSAVSADGRWVAYWSADAHVVPGQQMTPAWDSSQPTVYNLFLFDRLSGTTRLVSHASGSAAVTGDGSSGRPAMTADGRFIAFLSAATNLTSPPLAVDDRRFTFQLFVFDRTTGDVTLVSRSLAPDRTRSNGQVWDWAWSADGRFLAFASDATDVVTGITFPPVTGESVFLLDRTSGVVSLVSRSAADPAAAATSSGLDTHLSLSADGRYLALASTATNLVTGQTDRQIDSQDTADIFLWDRATGAFRLVSHANAAPATTANAASRLPSLSADGRVLAFLSPADDLLPGLANFGEPGLYLYDVGSGALSLASPPGFPVDFADLSRDGRFTAYSGIHTQVYLYDRQTDQRTLVSHNALQPGTGGGGLFGFSTTPRISGDGRYVAYASISPDLVVGQLDSDGNQDVFLFDRQSGASALVSGRAGSAVEVADSSSEWPVLSADGTTVVFGSFAGDLVAGDSNGVEDVFLYRRNTRPGAFFTVPPCRLLDTRLAGQTALASGAAVAWGLCAACGIPSTAKALSVNVTIVAPTGAGFLTLFAGDAPLPPTSTINFRAGQVRANNAVVPLAAGGDGTLAAFASIAGNGAVHVVLDVDGYFE